MTMNKLFYLPLFVFLAANLGVPSSAHADPLCGDGILEGLEECDDGALNSDPAPNACRTNCLLPHCGDDTVDSGEECDDGFESPPINSDIIPDACRTSCVFPRCGDGVADVMAGEQCDLGAANSSAPGAQCNLLCFIPYCGNGTIDAGEECDDGSQNSDLYWDACRTNCRAAHCGDGVVDSGEPCDEGSANSDHAPDTCRDDCSLPDCGDGVVDAGLNEECDQGALNGEPLSECAGDCQFKDWDCGDGLRNTVENETCDDGNTLNTDSCTNLCRPALCGDAFHYAAQETCDGAQCDYACWQSFATCGNGTLDVGEACDAGAANADTPDAACRTDCSPGRCGDGIVDLGEECDRSPGCAPDCRRRRVPPY